MRDRSSFLSPAGRVLLVLGTAVVLAASACGGTGAPPATRPGQPAATPAPGGIPRPGSTSAAPPPVTPGGPAQPRAGTWRLLPRGPIPAGAQLLVTVWTGREMLIHGIVSAAGNAYRGVTYAYRPATRSWVTLAAGPAPLMTEDRDAAVWTGSEMIVFGLTSAAYSPASNSWRPVPRAPHPIAAAAWVWTGRQAIFWGGGCCGGASADGVAYTPATNSWQRLPPGPLSARRPLAGAWTGKEMIIAGGWRPGSGAARPARTFADAAAYNPATRTWRKLPPMPGARYGANAVYDGREVLYLGGGRIEARAPASDAMAYSLATGHWRRLPGMQFARWNSVAVWTGRDVLVWGGTTGTYLAPVTPPHGEAYRPAGSWSALPMSPLRGRSNPVAVWTGTSLIVWGGWADNGRGYTWFTDGASYTPGSG